MTLPVSERAAIKAGEIVRKLDNASAADLPIIVEELRALLAEDGSSLPALGDRLASPLPRIMYLAPGFSKFGSVVWPFHLRREAIKIFENHLDIRTVEDKRKVVGILQALKSRSGRMTRPQADIVEGVVWAFKGHRW